MKLDEQDALLLRLLRREGGFLLPVYGSRSCLQDFELRMDDVEVKIERSLLVLLEARGRHRGGERRLRCTIVPSHPCRAPLQEFQTVILLS